MAEGSGHAPQSRDGIRPASNGRPPLAILPSEKWRRREVTLPILHAAGRSGFKPAPILDQFRLRGPRGRSRTCVGPFRRRMPLLLGHAEKMALVAGVPPATPRSKRGMICVSPHEDMKSGPPARNCTRDSTFARSRDQLLHHRENGGAGDTGSAGLNDCQFDAGSSDTASTSLTSASGSRSSFCMISSTRSLQPARQ